MFYAFLRFCFIAFFAVIGFINEYYGSSTVMWVCIVFPWLIDLILKPKKLKKNNDDEENGS